MSTNNFFLPLVVVNPYLFFFWGGGGYVGLSLPRKSGVIKNLNSRGSGGPTQKQLWLFWQSLAKNWCQRKPAKKKFWANFFMSFLKRNRFYVAQNLIGGQKPFLRGWGSFWILEGVIKNFRRGRNPPWPPPPCSPMPNGFFYPWRDFIFY